jgi:hypothetical protein
VGRSVLTVVVVVIIIIIITVVKVDVVILLDVSERVVLTVNISVINPASLHCPLLYVF